jgi:hypothetical protein
MINKNSDFQTESFRAWKSTKKEIKSFEESNPISVEYKDLKLILVGFTKVFEPETNKLAFAYKFKDDTKVILFHNVEGIQNKKIESAKKLINQISQQIGYTILDSQDYVKNIYNEKHNLFK